MGNSFMTLGIVQSQIGKRNVEFNKNENLFFDPQMVYF
jgi:hypothetical protein